MSIRWRRLGPALAVLVAVITAMVLQSRDDVIHSPTNSEPVPVDVSSNATRATTFGELMGSADLIVRGKVSRTAHGRMFGDPGNDALIESRLVTLTVTAVLQGEAPAGDLLIEEEGWTQDGAPLIVDGASPSVAGDDGIWFLTLVDGPEGPAYVTVSAQGRYLVHGDELRGAAGNDPLIAEIAALSPGELTELVVLSPS